MLSRIAIPCLALILLLQSNAHGMEMGREAPDCRFTPLKDEPVRNVRHYRGEVLYVDFWASWCGPCAQSFPFMNALDRDFRERGLRIVGVNLDENPEDAETFLAQYPASFTIVADAGGQCAKDFGVQAMPSSYLIDRQGVIRHVHLGFRPGEAQEIRAWVEELLSAPSPDEVR